MRTTNSSISSSEPAVLAPGRAAAGGDAPAWARFAAWLLGVAGALLATLLALVVFLDPYDTGRFALLRTPGVADQGPRTAHASRGRDPAFGGAIFGNSHLQLVSPERLKEATGVPFVSLTVPATGPKEQFALIDYFVRTRPAAPKALVIATDGYWCGSDPAMPNWKPFPFWLYDPDPLAYLSGLIRYDTLEEITRRIELALGRRARARPDGYWDYEGNYVWRAEAVAVDLARRHASAPTNLTGAFPPLDRLRARIAALPPETVVVLVRPPVYVTSLPQPGTPEAEAEASCLAALRMVAAGRPRTALVDWRRDRPENRMIENYFDHTHYRTPIARALEADIAAAIRQEGGEKP